MGYTTPYMKKTTLLFDITGVLFWDSKLRFIRALGIRSVLCYLLKHRSNPLRVCLMLLQRMSTNQKQTLTPISYKNTLLPDCISAWQHGHITSSELLQQIMLYIEQAEQEGFFKSKLEKRIVTGIVSTLLDAEQLIKLAKPNRRLIKLIKKIKLQGKHKLIIVSNLAHETFDLLAQQHPELLELFEGVVISAHIGMVKPNTAIYEHVLNHYGLDANNCLFIDDQEDNIIAAQTMGITGIMYRRFGTVKQQLKQFGVVD